MKTLLIIGISIVLAFACQNLCNGHGECDTGDKCACFPGWGGSECILRSCPYGEAFVDILPGDLDHDGTVTTEKPGTLPTDYNYHSVKTEWSPVSGTPETLGAFIVDSKRAHRYAECSNVGTCDRGTGLCECYSGYEGSACQRRSCPSSSEGLVCSGHGMCMSSEASIIHKGKPAGSVSLPSGWEYEKFNVCVCDKGWTGISCGSRICPKGLDPVKVGKVEYKFSISTTNAAYGSSSANTNSHYYEMEYDGVKYTTPIIPARTDVCTSASSKSEAAEDIRRALVSIPPLSQAKVSITCDSSNPSNIASIDITTPHIELDLSGSGSDKCGDGKTCSINTAGGTTGSIPTDTKIKSFNAVNAVTPTNKDEIKAITLTVSTSGDITGVGADSYISCSGRGICDGSSGLCKCFDNYSGVACEKTRNQ